MKTFILNNTDPYRKFTFKLSDEFLENYKGKQPNWGPLGYVTAKRTYCRNIPNENRTEDWWEVIKRVVEGEFTIQKKHCLENGLFWDEKKAEKSATETYKLMWDFKFLPPGRGLWMMGTDYVKYKGGMALNNCAFTSTKTINEDPTESFCWTMDALMQGVGVGFDTKGTDKLQIIHPSQNKRIFKIPDTREGWVHALKLLINNYTLAFIQYNFDYSLVRKAGEPIHGFGGTASGPGPLREMLNSIKMLFESKIGSCLSSVDIVDIFNYIAKCVVAGNVRRSAQIAIGQPYDKEFVECKQDAKALSDHRWASNNSIFGTPGMDYEKVANMIAVNGEPGIIYLENMRKYGRMGRKPDWLDKKVDGVNPSLRKGTRILTDNGIYPIEKLEGKEIIINNLHNKKSKAKCFLSGKNKQLYKLTLEGNHEYYCTPEHKWPIFDNGNYIKKETKNIKIGDWIPIIKQDSLFNGKIGSRDEGFFFGYNLGDGWIHKRHDDGNMQIGFILNNEEYNSNAKNIIEGTLKKYGSKSILHKQHGNENDYELNTTCHSVTDKFKEFKFFGKKYGIPKFVFEKASEDFRKGFIDGLITSDGSISKINGRISFTSSHKKLAKDFAELLGFYGIRTSLLKRTLKNVKFPNGKTYNRKYTIYQLRISDLKSKVHFSKIFKLTNKRKQKLLDSIKDKDINRVYYSNMKVKNIELTDIYEDVYDITVYDDTHCFQIGHCITGNCGEMSLEDREMCTLVETFPSRHENYEDFQHTLKYAYMYGKTVTLLKTNYPKTNNVMQKNKRIGISQTGIIDAFAKHGRKTILNWSDKGYKYLKNVDKKYSNDWLCVQPSKKLTTVKPSGTVSLLPGVSPGIHYPHSEYYIRRIRFAKNNKLIPILKDAGYNVYGDPYAKVGNDYRTYCVDFPVHEKHFDRAKEDVSMWEQVANAIDYQKYWADNQVSITVTFDKNESKDIKYVLQTSEDKLKGLAMLPLLDHTYEAAPYETITKDKYDFMVKNLNPINFDSIKYDLSNGKSIAKGVSGCKTDVCEIKYEIASIGN